MGSWIIIVLVFKQITWKRFLRICASKHLSSITLRFEFVNSKLKTEWDWIKILTHLLIKTYFPKTVLELLNCSWQNCNKRRLDNGAIPNDKATFFSKTGTISNYKEAGREECYRAIWITKSPRDVYRWL